MTHAASPTLCTPPTKAKAAVDLATLAQLDSQLHAWAHLPQQLAVASSCDGPLTGVHFGVKDVLDVCGMPTLYGSQVTKHTPQQKDAQCVALLRQAGAIPVGKTVTAEFAHVTPGPTCNPHSHSHTPGGSSSGSAAAVAAGMVPLALGTQTGGSMIRPAAYCGVLGFKPSYGLVARDGMRVMCPSLDVIGWFADGIPLLRKAAQVLLPRDAATVPPQSAPRIAALLSHPGFTLHPDAHHVLEAALSDLQSHGYSVETAHAPASTQQLIDTHHVLVHYEMAHHLLAQPHLPIHGLSPALQATIAHGSTIPSSQHAQSLEWQSQERGAWQRYFGNADLVLTSSVTSAAPPGLLHTGESGFNKGWSVLGWPCLHLPTGWSKGGLPLGVLLVARPGWDHALLAWAEVLHPLLDRRAPPQI